MSYLPKHIKKRRKSRFGVAAILMLMAVVMIPSGIYIVREFWKTDSKTEAPPEIYKPNIPGSNMQAGSDQATDMQGQEKAVTEETGLKETGQDTSAAIQNTVSDTTLSDDIPEADVYIALTFDDGPTGSDGTYPDGYTATLLDELKKRNVHATFFMCGYRIRDFNGHMKRYLEEGHELGNHTMNHPMEHLTRLDPADIREEVASNSALIESYTGQKPTVMRPVGGGVNSNVKEQMQELGLPIINWSVDTQDWKTKNDPDSVKKHIIDEVKDGDIVLMHDLWKGTLPGVLEAIDELQSSTDKTYAFVTVSELAAVHGITLEPGVVYSDLSPETAAAIANGSYREVIFD